MYFAYLRFSELTWPQFNNANSKVISHVFDNLLICLRCGEENAKAEKLQ
jgi:hypothetical protein